MEIPDFSGQITNPGDPGWDEARQAYNLAVDQQPAAVLHPSDPADVSAAIRFAASEGLAVAPQSTGHNANPLSLHGALLMKTGGLDEIEIDAGAKRARVGSGVRWGQVVEAAAPHGLAALHGSSGTVGVAGYSLMGGIGWYSRSRGLQTNALTAIELVTADGAEHRVDADNEAELFWALRGGGGAYGVVTALEFDLFECREVYAGMSLFGWEHSLDLLREWHRLTAEWPDELTTSFRILQVPDIEEIPEPLRGGKFAVVDGSFEGPADAGEKLTEPLREVAEPIAHTWGTVPATALGFLHMDPPDPVPGISASHIMDDVSEDAMEKLVEISGPGSDSPMTVVELRHIGGALGREPDGCGALGGLDGEYLFFSVGSPVTPELGAAIEGYLPGLSDVLSPAASKRSQYLNFSENATDPGLAFDSETLERLRKVKADHDPEGVIRANHAP